MHYVEDRMALIIWFRWFRINSAHLTSIFQISKKAQILYFCAFLDIYC
jgi:hypothetical protein